jgi:hypothetical protein
MDDALVLTHRVAEIGDVVEVEPVFELSPEAMAYLASTPAEFAPEPAHG